MFLQRTAHRCEQIVEGRVAGSTYPGSGGVLERRHMATPFF
jgi:hypothetical protein